MIRELRRRFIISIAISALALLTVVVSSINLVNVFFTDWRLTYVIRNISENDGVFESDGLFFDTEVEIDIIDVLINNEEFAYISRFFFVELTKDGDIVKVDTRNVAAIDDDTALKYTEQIMSSGKTKGVADYIYKYLVVENAENYRICFLDVSHEMRYMSSMFVISFGIAVFFFFLLFIVIVFSSKFFVRPVEENSRRQKQFITDAGHELKTPLAIISANTEVLEMTCGTNDWTASIRKQTGRMTELVNNMLVLAKMEERADKKSFKTFSLSEVVRNTANSFIILAEKGNKTIRLSVWPSIDLFGNEKSISELVTILIDNAVKYSPDDSVIEVHLNKKGKNIVFETENEIAGDETIDTKRLFDRFFRADKSRSRATGGYGIGLSIAKAVVEKHKGSINAQALDGKIKFTVTFNTK